MSPVIFVFDAPELDVMSIDDARALELDDLRRVELYDATGVRLRPRVERGTPAFCAPSKTLHLHLDPEPGPPGSRLAELLRAALSERGHRDLEALPLEALVATFGV